jgi:hypothetical protein
VAPNTTRDGTTNGGLWRITKRVMGFILDVSLVNPGVFALSDPEKAEALADHHET